MEELEWGQYQRNFNDSCPQIPGTGEDVYVGCTAVAMAQIMYYWNCQLYPSGSHSYDWKNTTLTANFGAAGYDWSSMDKYYGDSENQKLLYHCAVACEMNFDSDGSSSTPGRARDGMMFFGIDESANVKWRVYHPFNWADLLQAELDQSRPILYSGGGLSGGHSWVLSGYDDISDQYWCNWGWYGNYDGSYSLGGFNPGGTNLNMIESGIFSAVPTTMGIPDIEDAIIQEGSNIITIPIVTGAQSYEWVTTNGTITGTTNTATLTTNSTAIVSVRAVRTANAGLCTQYTPWSSATMSIINPTISGPTILCEPSGGFYLHGLHPNTTVTWSKSPNVDWIGTPSSTGAVVQPNTTTGSDGWVTASLSYPGGSENLTADFWVGKPMNFSISGPTEIAIGTNYSYSIPFSAIETSDFSTTWTTTGPITINSSTYQGCSISASSCGPSTLTATLSNCNGTTASTLSIYIDCYQPLAYPNPANETLYLDPNYSQGDAIDFQFDLYNESGIKKKEKKSKGEIISISISSLPEGSYYIKAKMNKKDGTKTEKTIPIIVKH